MSQQPLVIEIVDASTARFGDVTLKARGMQGPISPLARKMIDDGLARPFDLVEVRTDQGTLCFHSRALIHWASIACVETADRPAHFKVHRPMPEGVFRGDAA
jgi:hypothetical protein